MIGTKLCLSKIKTLTLDWFIEKTEENEKRREISVFIVFLV